MAPASSYPLALAPLLPGAFSPLSSRISAEVLTGDSPLVYITSKDTPKMWRRSSADPSSHHKITNTTDCDVEVGGNHHWGNHPHHHHQNILTTDAELAALEQQDSYLTVNPYQDHCLPSTHVSCITTSSLSSAMNHIGPGLHQTSLTLATPLLACTGFLKKEGGFSLAVEDHQIPFIRRRSVNVPLQFSSSIH